MINWDATPQIDWNTITVVDSGVVAEPSSISETTVLDDNDTRYAFETDLQELQCFLHQRSIEQNSGDTLAALSAPMPSELLKYVCCLLTLSIRINLTWCRIDLPR